MTPDHVGLCHICGGPATQTCMRCGRITCKNCLDKNYVCQHCAAGLQ